MPLLAYRCSNCGHTLEKFHAFTDNKRLKKCPECKRFKLFVDCSGVGAFSYQEPGTIAHLADRNTTKAGRYQLEDARKDMPKPKKDERPWWRDTAKVDHKLADMTPSQKKKYIEKGEK